MDDQDLMNGKGRDFICACGKNYLSYAALFTHIKQKHDGKAPGPIVRPRSQRKRGRPRKNPQNPQESIQEESGQEKDLNFNSSENFKIRQNILDSNQKNDDKAKSAVQVFGNLQTFQAFNRFKKQTPSNEESKMIEEKQQVEEVEKIVQKKIQNLEEECKNKIKTTIQTIFMEREEISQERQQKLSVLGEKFFDLKSGKEENPNSILDFLIEFYNEFIEKLNFFTNSQKNQYKILLWTYLEFLQQKHDRDIYEKGMFTKIKEHIVQFIEDRLPLIIEKQNLKLEKLFSTENVTQFFVNVCNWISLKESEITVDQSYKSANEEGKAIHSSLAR